MRRVVVLGVFAIASSTRGGTICFVDDDALPGGDGTTWPTAYQFLQDALQAAADGTEIVEIRIAEGVYAPDCAAGSPEGSGDRTASFAMVSGVAVYGGFAGPDAGAPDDRDPALYPTVLTGDLLGDDEPDGVNRTDNSYHVVRAEDVDATGRLDGVVVTAGYAVGAGTNRFGAGLYVLGGSPTLAGCVVRDNEAAGGFGLGGGGYLAGTQASVHGCVFEDNVADSEGGGVFAAGGAPLLTGCRMSGNTAPSGGGMRVASGNALLLGCTFDGNAATDGGAVHFTAPTVPLLVACEFTANTAVGDGGAAFHHTEASAHFVDTRFEGNTAGDAGGALYVLGSSPTVEGCDFVANQAAVGGGISGTSASPLIRQSSFSDNTAQLGGGYYSASGTPAVWQCTFTDNTASGGEARGGAIYTDYGPADVDDCVFVGNSAGEGGALAAVHGAGPQLVECAMLSNEATDAGGAILFVNLAGPTLTDCTIVGNTAGVVGGGLATMIVSQPALSGTIVCGNLPDPIDGIWDDLGGNTVADDCVATCPEDLTADGVVETTDFLVLLSRWGPCVDCDADFDGDGFVDTVDLLTMLAAWGPCPEPAWAPPGPDMQSGGRSGVRHGNNPPRSAEGPGSVSR